MAYDFGGDTTTGFTNDQFMSFPPQSSFERDRLRLQRELDRDLDHPSFSSSSVSGLENAGRPFNYDDDTDTFDIDNDARATSTRKVNFNANMLQSSPPINSKILATEFADFSMAGNDYTEESIEIGRGRKGDKNLSSQDYAPRVPFSSRVAAKSASKRLSEAYAAAGRDMASPLPRLSRQNSMLSDTSDLLPPHKHNTKANNNVPVTKGRETGNKQMDEDTFDLPKQTQKKNVRQTSESSSGSKPRKTTEQVTSRGQGASNLRGMRVEDDASSVASLDDLVPPKTRKVSKNVGSNTLGGARAPSLRAAMRNAESRETANSKRKNNTTAAADVPKSFKSTAAFIQELGLDGHTVNLNLQDPPTYDETIDVTNQNTNEQSFLLPNIAGISELIGAEATRIYNQTLTASARKRNPNGQPPSHKPIESIPVPQDNRAILMAMQLLQDKMTALEEQKALTERRCEQLKDQLRRMREKYEAEYRRARVAEEEVGRRKRSTSTAAATGVEDTEALRDKVEDKERSKIALLVEKMKLENTITSQKSQIDEINHRFEITKIALKNMQDERNSAVNSAAAALASQKHLEEELERLRNEIDVLRVEKAEFEEHVKSERESWKTKEQILRRRIEKAREAEGIAREAVQGLQQRLNQLKKDGAVAEPESAMAEWLKKELEKIKPSQAAPAPGATPPSAPGPSRASSKRKSTASDLATHSAPATVSIAAALQHEAAPANSKRHAQKADRQAATEQITSQGSTITVDDAANETAYTVDGNYIRRIADEIEEERRRRKEAERRAAVATAEMEKIREIINSKPTTRRKTTTMVATKKVGESATSGLEDNTTNMRNVPARPLSAPPVSDKAPKPKQRRVRKVVYYEEGDTTEVLPQAPKVKTVTIESRASASAAAVGINGEAPAQSSTQARPVGSTSEEHDTFHTARKNSSSNSRNRAMSTPSFEFEHKETNDNTNFPPPPIIPDHIKSVIDPEAEHDPVTCTVCNRRSSLDGSGGVFDMSHFTLEKSHEKGSGYEEANTLRPSRPAGKQLGKVVRGLQDEFVHLKMAYQEKAEEFLSLDPARGKRRRKEITREINDMVAEMDWKCDMIYALYDVAEEVITSRKQHAAASKSTSAAKGKAPVRGVYFQNKDGVDSEDDDFERGLQKELSRSGAKLVDIDGEEASGAGAEGHRNDEDTTATISATMAVGQNEISLLDESNELDDTNMEVARHLARQHKEMEKQLGNGNGSRKQDKVVMDSYDEGDSSF